MTAPKRQVPDVRRFANTRPPITPFACPIPHSRAEPPPIPRTAPIWPAALCDTIRMRRFAPFRVFFGPQKTRRDTKSNSNNTPFKATPTHHSPAPHSPALSRAFPTEPPPPPHRPFSRCISAETRRFESMFFTAMAMTHSVPRSDVILASPPCAFSCFLWPQKSQRDTMNNSNNIPFKATPTHHSPAPHSPAQSRAFPAEPPRPPHRPFSRCISAETRRFESMFFTAMAMARSVLRSDVILASPPCAFSCFLWPQKTQRDTKTSSRKAYEALPHPRRPLLTLRPI